MRTAPITTSPRTSTPRACGRWSANASERQDLSRHVVRLTRRGRRAERPRVRRRAQPRARARSSSSCRRWRKLSATVLILGESGTGKELLARLIHRESRTAERAVRGGQPGGDSAGAGREHAVRPREGRVHRRHPAAARQVRAGRGGTLFLDEIGDLRYELQAKLLRAIQEGEIERVGGTHPIKTNFRLIAATNIDLDEGGEGGAVPRGPLLPAQRHPDPDAGAARPHRGPARAGAVLPAPLQPEVPQEHSGHRRLDAADPRRTTGGRATSASSRT